MICTIIMVIIIALLTIYLNDFVSVRFAWDPVGSSLVCLCEAVGVVAHGLYGPRDIPVRHYTY